MKRCEKTELPVDQCGDTCCRPDLAQPAPVEPVKVAVQFRARYDSHCDHCDGRIVAGEQMAYDRDEQRVCKRHLS